MRMNRAARFTGSSSDSDAAKAASYSALLQRLLFRLCHLLAFCESSDERNWRMLPAGSCEPNIHVNICMSAQNFPKVSGLPTSDEKKTDAATDFNSRSMPAFCAACLTIACSFWRVALMEVW